MRRFKRSLRGLAVDDIFDLVWRTEREISLIGNDSQPSIYRRIGSWLVQAQYLSSFKYLDPISAPPNLRIPDFCIDLSPQGALKFISAYVFSKRHAGSISAEAIRIKNNIRTFYINAPFPFSSKILFDKTRSVHDMKKEIEVRSRVASFHTVKIPGILHCNLDHDPPFFCEEIIAGRRANPSSDGAQILQSLCPLLWQTYEMHGITLRSIQEVVDSKGAMKKLDDACNLVKWDSRWCDKNSFLSLSHDLLKSVIFLPYSTGHGDLSLGNMIVGTDGHFYIVDWECAKEMPVVFDLFAILKNVPQSREYFESKIDKIISANRGVPIFSFHEQCFLAVLVRIINWESSQEYHQIIGSRKNSFRRKLCRNFFDANSFLSKISQTNESSGF